MTALTLLVFAGAWLAVNALHVSQIKLPVAHFDPRIGEVHGLLLKVLGKSSMVVTPMANNVGLNGGIWVLSDPQKQWGDLVLKSRLPEEAISPKHLPEPEHYMKLYSEHPTLATDPLLIFPLNIVACLSPTGEKLTDLIVMRRAPGTTLGQYISEKFAAGIQGRRELYAFFEHLGQVTRQFHNDYGKQHTDFQTSNIMVDKADGDRITFIDLGVMGQPVADNDLLHLQETLQVLSDAFPPASYLELAFHHFEKGYFNKAFEASPQPESQVCEVLPGAEEPQGSPASCGSQSLSPGNTIHVVLHRAHADKLGLSLLSHDGVLIVKNISSGLVELFNSQNPDTQVQAGQRLLEVNGRHGYHQMLAAVTGGIERGDFVHVWSQSQKTWARDGWILQLNEDGFEVEYQGGSLQKTLPFGSPELVKVLALTFANPHEFTA